MNIIDKARKIKKEQKSAAELERIADEARWAKSDAEEKQLRGKIIKALTKSLKSTKDLIFTFQDKGNYGELVMVQRRLTFGSGVKSELQCLGMICLQKHTYQWRGSDESPEQDITGTYLEFKQILNGDAEISVSISNYKSEEPIKEFEEALAEYLVKYV